MEEGWVYVLVNSSVPGLVKVGRTAREPAQRAAELSAVTGVATPFVVAFERYFDDCHTAEWRVHAELDRRGWRISLNREFFLGSASDVIRVVLDAGLPAGTAARARPLATADALLEAGERALHGIGEALQDTGEAIRCFKLAACRGSPLALERLGGIYGEMFAGRMDAASRRRAMTPLKEGARRGNPYCYCEMSAVFAAEGHLANFHKAWALFFARCPMPAAGSAEATRFTAACGRYVELCLELQEQPGHLVELRALAQPMLALLMAQMDSRRAHPVRRQRAAAALRWTYAMLPPDPPQPARANPVRLRWRRWLAAPAALPA